jgi:hypothetical protein
LENENIAFFYTPLQIDVFTKYLKTLHALNLFFFSSKSQRCRPTNKKVQWVIYWQSQASTLNLLAKPILYVEKQGSIIYQYRYVVMAYGNIHCVEHIL